MVFQVDRKGLAIAWTGLAIGWVLELLTSFRAGEIVAIGRVSGLDRECEGGYNSGPSRAVEHGSPARLASRTNEFHCSDFWR